MKRRSIRFAIVAAVPLVVVELLLLTLRPDEPGRVGANSTPVNPKATSHVFPFTNDTGQQATDLHITFSSPIEKPSVTTQPSDCDASDPTGPEITQPADDQMAAVWSVKCIDPLAGAGSTVMIKVFSKDPGVEPVSWTWTNHGTPIPTITPESTVTTTPSASPSTTASPSVTVTPETPTSTPDTPTSTPDTPTSTNTPVTPTNTPAVPPTNTYTNTPPSTNTPGPQPKICGDVDLTKSVTSIDAALVLQFSASLLDALRNPRNADVNADNQITSIDSLLILQHVAGLLPELDCA